jgi:hypothetical protein
LDENQLAAIVDLLDRWELGRLAQDLEQLERKAAAIEAKLANVMQRVDRVMNECAQPQAASEHGQ